MILLWLSFKSRGVLRIFNVQIKCCQMKACSVGCGLAPYFFIWVTAEIKYFFSFIEMILLLIKIFNYPFKSLFPTPFFNSNPEYAPARLQDTAWSAPHSETSQDIKKNCLIPATLAAEKVRDTHTDVKAGKKILLRNPQKVKWCRVARAETKIRELCWSNKGDKDLQIHSVAQL